MSNDPNQRGSNSEERIRRILNTARREVGLRDVMMFGFSAIWSVLFVIGETSASFLNDAARMAEKSPTPREGTLTKDDQRLT